jgi:hypothetical protein
VRLSRFDKEIDFHTHKLSPEISHRAMLEAKFTAVLGANNSLSEVLAELHDVTIHDKRSIKAAPG